MASFLGRYYYKTIYPGAFYGSHTFPCCSLLSTTVLNDTLAFCFDVRCQNGISPVMAYVVKWD